ncbi:MAG: FMN-binding negative transcriptional regulator [Bacteroidota bacterium]
MYTPPRHKESDRKAILDFMKKYSFATMVTAGDGKPIATHVPFIVEERNGKTFLLTHIARANDQWKDFENKPVLVIFHEPHAYVSAKFYDNKEDVPTWNYVAVHAYGTATIISSREEIEKLFLKTFDFYDPSFHEQWKNDLSDQYKEKLIARIVACEIEVTELQGKKKLSQNYSVEEVKRMIAELSHSDDTLVRTTAAMMEEELKKRAIP